MNRIDLTKLGGFPATQYTLDFLQKSFSDVLGGMAKTFGDKVILTGCEVTGNQISDGWISWNGEILPFSGGAISPSPLLQQIAVTEVKASRLFQDNEEKEVYYIRVAKVAVPGTLLTMFARLDPLSQVWQRGDIKDVVCTAQHITDNFDLTGLGKNQRKGWAICNGSNGTPNMKQRVSVGYDAADVRFNLPGKIGGVNEQAIEGQNLPAIKIDVPIPTSDTSQDTAGAGKIVLGNGANDLTGGPTLRTNNLGAGIPLNIMQAYTVTLKIMKL